MSASEFIDAPAITRNLYTSAKPTLTNISQSNIALQFFNTDGVIVNVNSGHVFDAVIQFKPDEFVFYDDVVVSRADDTNYNLPKINKYIQNKILSASSTPLPLPTAAIKETGGGNHVLSINSEGIVTKTTSKTTENLDHIEIFTSVDVNNNLACIVYKDKQGLSYSLDGGVTIIPISNVNLLYPLEITSVAIQTYSEPLLDKPSPRIYIGTLREGIKTFAPNETAYSSASGMDSFIQLEESGLPSTSTITVDAIDYTIHNIQYVFKHSLATNSAIKPTPDTQTGLNYSHTPGDFAPVYVLGVLNSPVDGGNPLLCYVRSNIERYNTPGTYDKITRYLSNNLRTGAKSYTKDLVYNIYRTAVDTSYIDELGWRVIQQTFLATTTRDPYKTYTSTLYSNPGLYYPAGVANLPATLVDVVKTININTSSDVLASDSGIVSAVNDNSGTVLMQFTVTPKVDSGARYLSIDLLPACGVLPKDITGFTAYWTSVRSESQFFITTPTKVRRLYSDSWSDFIVSDAWDINNQMHNLHLTASLHTFYNPVTDTPPIGNDLSVAIKSHLIGLREFSLLNIGNNEHLGIMGSDLGYVFTHFIKKIDDFVSPIGDFREFKFNLYSSWSTGLTYVPEARKLISCSLAVTPPLVYETPAVQTDPPLKYFLYDPTTESTITSKNGVKSKIFYKNYAYTESKYYFFNKYNSSTFDSNVDTHFDQQPFDVKTVEFIRVEPKPESAEILGIKYAGDATNLTSFSFLTGSNSKNDSTLATYLSTNSNKYRHLKIMLRVSQKLSPVWDQVVSETDSEFTYYIQP